MEFLVSKKDSVKNKRDLNEITELEIIFRFRDQLTASETAFFHERLRLLVIALQYNWRVAAANASGTTVPGIVAHLQASGSNSQKTTKSETDGPGTL